MRCSIPHKTVPCFVALLTAVFAFLRPSDNLPRASAGEKRAVGDGAAAGNGNSTDGSAEDLRRKLYSTRMSLANLLWHKQNLAGVLDLLRMTQVEQNNLRGFEWHYLNRLCHASHINPTGMSEDVRAVAFSPDGRHLAVHSVGGSIWIFDLATGKAVRQVFNVESAIHSRIAYSPDGQRLAGTNAGELSIWEVASGKLLTRNSPNQRKSWGRGLAFSRDGKWLAFARAEGVQLWDVPGGAEAFYLQAGEIRDLAFSADSKRLAAVIKEAGAATVRVWDVAARQEVAMFSQPGRELTSIAFSPDGQRLALGGAMGLSICNAVSGKELQLLPAAQIRGVIFSADGDRLTGVSGSAIKVWTIATGEEHLSLLIGDDMNFAFRADGLAIAAAAANSLGTWDLSAPPASFTLGGHALGAAALKKLNQSMRIARFYDQGNAVTAACLSFDPGGNAATIGPNSSLRIWDVGNGREIRTISARILTDAVLHPSGKMLASSAENGAIKVWDAATGKELRSHHAKLGYLFSPIYSPDGKWLAAIQDFETSTVMIWEAATGQAHLTLRKPPDQISGIAFSADGRRLATASDDRTVRLWDVANGNELLRLTGHTAEVCHVAFSPDGLRLASAGHDRTARLWSVADGKLVQTFRHASWISALAYSPDGERLAAAAEGIIRIWNVGSGLEVLTLAAHLSKSATPQPYPVYRRLPVHALAFSPDGRRLVAIDGHGAATVWNGSPIDPDVPVRLPATPVNPNEPMR